MNKMGGLAGKILRVDLARSEISTEETEKYAEKYLGGRMINSFILLKEMDPKTRFSDPENLLIFGVGCLAGTLAPGADADVVIWDPERKLTYGVAHSHQRTDYNLFEGWELTGFPEKVFLRGKLIVDGDRWLGQAGMGRYLVRQPYAPVI